MPKIIAIVILNKKFWKNEEIYNIIIGFQSNDSHFNLGLNSEILMIFFNQLLKVISLTYFIIYIKILFLSFKILILLYLFLK